MNWERIEGNWKQLTKGQAKEQWGKLTDDDLDVVAGRRDQLAGRSRSATAWPKKTQRSRSPTGNASATDSWFTTK